MNDIINRSMDIINRSAPDNSVAVLAALQKNNSDRPLKTIENFRIIMSDDNVLKNCVRFNELSNSPETLSGRKWTDADDSIIKCYIENVYGIRSVECYVDAFNIMCYSNRYNPIKQIIDGAIWDGKSHIATVLQKFLKCDDTDYTREVARLIFTGGIARLYSPGCKFDYMPILRGKQGCGKSTFVEWLALRDDFFGDISQFEGQPAIEQLDGIWIGEVSELLAVTRSKESEGVKAFITRRNDAFRRSYDRRVTENPRKCIMIGTTNRSEFLNDKSGARRFYPIEVKADGFELYRREKDCRAEIMQCWLEAKHNYDTGNYSLAPNTDLLNAALDAQIAATQDDWRVGVIEDYIASKTKICVKELWDKALGLVDRDCAKKDSSDIVQIMDNFNGWEKVGTRRTDEYGNQRVWVKKPISKSNLPFQTEMGDLTTIEKEIVVKREKGELGF